MVLFCDLISWCEGCYFAIMNDEWWKMAGKLLMRERRVERGVKSEEMAPGIEDRHQAPQAP